MDVPGNIVVVGSINTDLVVNTPRLPSPGETVTGSSFATFGGGKGANQAVAAARCGARVVMIGALGSDDFGTQSRTELGRHGIDCTHVQTVDGTSGVALITVSDGGDNTIVVVPGANAAVTPEVVRSKRDVLRQAGIVLAQLEIPLASVLTLAQICKEDGIPLMLDPAPACELPDELLTRCEWFTPNETEAAFFSGNSGAAASPAAIATALHQRGARNVILKRGEQGAWVGRPGQTSIELPAFRVRAIDTTAAGDTFNGAFAAALVEGRSVEECGRIAGAAAALSVTRRGAQASMPDAQEILSFLRSQLPGVPNLR